ncbi:MAG: DUF2752 domain-containing protein [Lachnospiraceae bacterium]|nr:DUF2752 domain-containing protein [Lachnospiraceae bacterium]
MKQHESGLAILKRDISNLYKGILAAVIYCLGTHFLFGQACPMVLLTGFPCPGCGLTRAGIALLTLNWKAAWQLNCVIFLIGGFLIYYVLCRYILRCRCYGQNVFLGIIVLSLLVLYGYRMSHIFPSHAPMEYYEFNLFAYLRMLFSG